MEKKKKKKKINKKNEKNEKEEGNAADDNEEKEEEEEIDYDDDVGNNQDDDFNNEEKCLIIDGRGIIGARVLSHEAGIGARCFFLHSNTMHAYHLDQQYTVSSFCPCLREERVLWACIRVKSSI
ncbi:PREDICTED: uncharacterized protein LOC106821229 [Priapulus caudatus]|uniref:Uncharacterized protein LOC106821229 n=1 Tax=Priapulus caudatus TaxID=37621 RepID=A0ABM1FAF6_PRICU|nr:PREDICTED: uncharacterized protein LOC106821229 [Priapulus caudatus]